MDKNFRVTPWEVTGEVDYAKLIEQFGTQPLTDALLKKIEQEAGGLHLFLRRGFFFSHRDLDWIFRKYDAGEKFALYTGRGPSGDTHLGHLVPWMFTKYLQDTFGANLYFQITDDEKFLVKQNLTLEDTEKYAYENILDIIALGFDPKKTFIFKDTEYAKTLYKTAIRVAKHVTFSTAKAVFGFNNDSNIGLTFFPAMQAAPCFFPSELEKRNVPILIPAAIDQDPYWRIARDVAPKLGYYKPAAIHCKFLSGLGKGGKMSSSLSETAVYTTDSAKVATKKVMGAFTGGRATVEEQKKLGGEPEKCVVHEWLHYLFEEDDKKIKELYADCKAGKIMCGECKKYLAQKVCTFLEKHQQARERAKDKVDQFMLRD